MQSLFYEKDYLKIQQHQDLKVIENEDLRIIFSLDKDGAYSLPRGLFGSFACKRSTSFDQLHEFWLEVKDELRNEGTSKVLITHPPEIYDHFVPLKWLQEVGFEIQCTEINHHIDLRSYHLHDMERRKLQKLTDMDFKVEKSRSLEDLQRIYPFIADCRNEKGLSVNISLEKLAYLFRAFPKQYFIFMGYLENTLVSALIAVEISEQVVYYYLPATVAAYKKHSPMVGLMETAIQYFMPYYDYLDLGVSSEEGIPQEGLVAFKERMGGIRSNKVMLKATI